MSRVRSNRLSVTPLENRLTPATFTVTNLADGFFAGTLRWAVGNANALAGADTVDCTKVAGTITLTLGELSISEAATVLGPGASVLTISGGGASRIFNTQTAAAGSLVTFSGLTLTAGKSASSGGAIAGDDQDISLRSCVLTGNTAATRGGGISVNLGGSLIATASSFLGNIGNTVGGGIDVGGFGAQLTLQGCTVANNYAPTGAGVHAENSFTIRDSTISRNKAQASGGGIHFLGSTATAAPVITLRNSTVSGNSCPGAGGGVALENFVGSFNVYNSTFTQNSAGGKGGAIGVMSGPGSIFLESCILQNDTAFVGPEISGGEVRAHATALFNPAGIGAFINLGGNLFFTDCKLGPLANNGGPTQTHKLLAGSPAIDVGANPLALVNDQRGAGFSRSKGAGTDMGAYERQGLIVPPFVTSFTINDGSVQRSMVMSLSIKFSEPVSFPAGPSAAVQLTWLPSSGPVDVPLLFTIDSSSTEMIVHWKLITSLPSEPSGSLPDGRFEFRIAGDGPAAVVGSEGALDGDGDGSPGGDFVARFHRLFGDADGDADVDAQDYGAFRQAFGTADMTFDSDGDGDVDAADFGALRRRFGTSV